LPSIFLAWVENFNLLHLIFKLSTLDYLQSMTFLNFLYKNLIPWPFLNFWSINLHISILVFFNFHISPNSIAGDGSNASKWQNSTHYKGSRFIAISSSGRTNEWRTWKISTTILCKFNFKINFTTHPIGYQLDTWTLACECRVDIILLNDPICHFHPGKFNYYIKFYDKTWKAL
jgi:hypothetical protein